MIHIQKSILERGNPLTTTKRGGTGYARNFCLDFFFEDPVFLCASNLQSPSPSYQSPGITGMYHCACRKFCFWFSWKFVGRGDCWPFRHFSLNEIDELALEGMIPLIALGLPVACHSSDAAPVSWVRKERLCQATGCCEPKPRQAMTWCFQGKPFSWPQLEALSKTTRLPWVHQVRL